MTTYNVQQISEMLGAKPETVRRWIRTGKLKATQKSKKEGNVIDEKDFMAFLEKTPKYTGLLAGLAATSSSRLLPLALIGGAAGGVVEGVTSSLQKKNQMQSLTVSDKNLKAYLENSIKSSQETIAYFEREVAIAEKAIQNEHEKIEEYRKLLSEIKKEG
jgi:uncharacterized protein YjcR